MSKDQTAALKIIINGNKLKARKAKGKWTFTCNEFPEIATKFDGSDSANPAVEEFTTRALQGAIIVKKLAGGNK